MELTIPETGKHARLAYLHNRRFRLRVGLGHAYQPGTRQRVALELADVDLRLVARYRGQVEHHARNGDRAAVREAMEAMAFHLLEAQGIVAEWG